ncbi:hypothetical protein [Desulfobacter curvatus]|uniref:hypothetical protein n=1 Tax=Desulfobacter curvatus TaxID=2290 RepID=UPI0003795879|nr:hypothetical protein [Desulfobacter curvatus]
MLKTDIKKNMPILFRKNTPGIKNDYKTLIEKVDQENNYHASLGEYSIFNLILADFGIDSIVYYGYDEPMLKGCEYEIRISPCILFESDSLAEMDEADINDIRFALYYDAWHGLGNIFSRQFDPNHLIGINLTERLNLSIDDPNAFFFDCFRVKCEHLPEKGNLEDLTPYVQEVFFTKGEKISDYQIRLLYNDPYAHFWDLVSAFRYINQSLGYFFDFQVDEG